MSKKKNRQSPDQIPPAAATANTPVSLSEPQVQSAAPTPPPAAAPRKPQYSFPTKSRCPRCQSTDTCAVSTQGKWQYRKCRRAICNPGLKRTYRVEGKRV